jgi:hypothetical protein
MTTNPQQLANLKAQAESDTRFGDAWNLGWFKTHQPLPLDQLGGNLEAYCLAERCKRKLASTPTPTIRDINGKLQVSGVCSKCGKRISSFVSKDKLKKPQQEGKGAPDLSQPIYNPWYKYPGQNINDVDYTRLWKHMPLKGESYEAYKSRIEYLYRNTVPYDLISNFYGAYLMNALNTLNQKGKPPLTLKDIPPLFDLIKEARKDYIDYMP